MNFSILTIGDEICIGQIINSNAAWIAEKLTDIGFTALYHSSVGDNYAIINEELLRLYSKSDVLIITGGLGPTHDDITKSVINEFFCDNLVIDQITLDHLSMWFESRGRTMTEINRNQALVPSYCTVLKNNVGTAPGLLFSRNNKLLLALPGVPAEMKSIFVNEFLPIVQKYFESNSNSFQLYITAKTAGIFESSLAELIGSPDYFPNGCTLAYLPSASGVRIRLGVNSNNRKDSERILGQFKEYIVSKVGKYIIGYGSDSILTVVAEILKNNNLTVSVAESCTGGLLGSAFTELSGSSEYFEGGVIAYSNEIKIKILDVNESTIKHDGAVSQKTAIELAQNVRTKFCTDFGISITGIAGPNGGTEDKPVGTVWIAITDKNETISKSFRFGNDRGMNRDRAVTQALLMLKERI